MRRREDKAITKHTLNLYRGDYEKLQTIYGTRIGAAKIIRDLVYAHIKYVENKAEQKVNMGLVDDLDVPVTPEGVQQ
jgi:hypothetical protein